LDWARPASGRQCTLIYSGRREAHAFYPMFGIRASENIGRRASKRLSARTFLGAFGDMITLSPVDGLSGLDHVCAEINILLFRLIRWSL
jgi:hypothetical protein